MIHAHLNAPKTSEQKMWLSVRCSLANLADPKKNESFFSGGFSIYIIKPHILKGLNLINFELIDLVSNLESFCTNL